MAKVHTSFTQVEVQILVFKNTLVKIEVLTKRLYSSKSKEVWALKPITTNCFKEYLTSLYINRTIMSLLANECFHAEQPQHDNVFIGPSSLEKTRK